MQIILHTYLTYTPIYDFKKFFFNFNSNMYCIVKSKQPEAELKELKSWFKFAKTRFKLSAGINLETFDRILSETNHN